MTTMVPWGYSASRRREVTTIMVVCRTRIRRRVLVVLAFLAAALAIGEPVDVDAAEPTCGTRGNYHVYWQPPPGQQGLTEGTYALLVNRFAFLCGSVTTSRNFTSAWTMIYSANGSGWAQSGHDRSWGTSMRYFAQQFSGGSGQLVTTFTPYSTSSGETHAYWQQYDASCACIHSNVDTTRLLNTGFNPYATWQTPFIPQYSAETAFLASDVPGSAVAPSTFSAMSFQYAIDHRFYGIPCPYLVSANDNPTRWATSPVSCTSVNIWTSDP